MKFPLALIGDVRATFCIVYAYLLLRCGFKGATDGKCFPSLRKLSQMLRLAKSTVLSALEELTEHGWIDRDKCVYEKNRKTKVYRSSAIALLPIPEKIDPSELSVRVETYIGRVLT